MWPLTLSILCLATIAAAVPRGRGSQSSEFNSAQDPSLDRMEGDDTGKRGWNALSGMWGKRGWNDLSGMWGKRGWNSMNGMWGKRNNWNNLSGMWGKRGWNDLSGMWGKRGWNSMNGMWGKRNNWNNLKAVWGKRPELHWVPSELAWVPSEDTSDELDDGTTEGGVHVWAAN